MKGMHMLCILIVFVTSSLLFTSCSSRQEEAEFAWDDLVNIERSIQEVFRSRQEHEAAIESPFNGHTITITLHDYIWSMWPYASFSEQFRRAHPGSNVEITVVEGDYDDLMYRLRVQMMAGETPTLIQASLMGYPNLPNFDYFADWLPLMEEHPFFIDDEWNMNIINSLRQGGRLLGFPAAIGIFYAVANKDVPELAEEFANRKNITISELLELTEVYDAISGGRLLADELLDFMLMQFFLEGYFDYTSGNVNFDNFDFIHLLNRLDDILPKEQIGGWWLDHGDMVLQGQFYMIQILRGMFHLHHFIFDIDTPFVNPIPIVNDSGMAVMNHNEFISRSALLLSEGASTVEKAMAMEFVLMLARVFDERPSSSPYYYHDGWRAGFPTWDHRGIPVRRDAMLLGREMSITWWRNVVAPVLGFPDGFLIDMPEAARYVISLKEEIANGPLVMPRYMPMAIENLMKDILSDFTHGIATAEETAIRLQNSVTLALIEQN